MLAWIGFVIAIGAQVQQPAPILPSPMPAFLAGCWEQREGDDWTEECWTAPRAGQMMGSSRSGTATSIEGFEFMRIVRAPGGSMAFHPYPGGNAAAPFQLAAADADSIEFRNPAHDYPQRIRYAIDGDVLKAEISLIDGNSPMTWTFRRSGASAPE